MFDFLKSKHHRPAIAFDYEIISEPYTRGLRIRDDYMPPRTWTQKEIEEFHPKLTKFLKKNGWLSIIHD